MFISGLTGMQILQIIFPHSHSHSNFDKIHYLQPQVVKVYYVHGTVCLLLYMYKNIRHKNSPNYRHWQPNLLTDSHFK